MPIYLQHGNLIDYVPPTDTSTEDVVFMGGLVGIPQAFIPAGELGALSVDGVYMFTKKDGVSVNLGDVVKYCGTTKLAQDSNADLTLGVAVADAEADSLGVKVKINSVLPTDGGGCGSGEVAISCGLDFNDYGYLYVNVAEGCGLAFNGDGQLVATGGGGGGSEVVIDTSRGLSETSSGVGINIGTGLSFGSGGALIATGGGGGGLQNLATGSNALSILGQATTSDDSIAIGGGADASGEESTAVGVYAAATNKSATALGSSAYANGKESTAVGIYAEASANYSSSFGGKAYAAADYATAIGASANASEKGVTVISARNDDGTTKTQLYLIGAGSTMSTTYCDGEAGLGFVSKDSSGNILKRGTIKLSAIMTENTDTFAPRGW